MIEEIEIRISGHVQGVGFRAVVSRIAAKHSISGFVRNLPDGRVEVRAQGTAPALEKFCDEIRRNPGRAKIERFEKKAAILLKPYSDFAVY